MSTMPLRPELPPLPPRMRGLPIDERGYPVPYFVAIIDGRPDHRVADAAKRTLCMRFRRCWLCGGPLGVFEAFVVGPMCIVNRVSSEPASHRECAEYAIKACPFLMRPKAHRREAGMPEDRSHAGFMIERNPGVTALWMTKGTRFFKSGNGVLVDIGEPTEVLWFCEGRGATRAEVLESIETGMPALDAMCTDATSKVALALERSRAMQWVPA